ncbi:MAG: hypothetical protein ACIARQ_11635 [Phycisphaerales bacterium JB061]|jgi:hypothetical protein
MQPGRRRKNPTPLYRHRFDSDVVHFRADCPQWPTRGYVVLPGLPSGGKLCPHCQAASQSRTTAAPGRQAQAATG